MNKLFSKKKFEGSYLILSALFILTLIFLRLDLSNVINIVVAIGVFIVFLICFKIAYEDIIQMEITALDTYVAIFVMAAINLVVLIFSGKEINIANSFSFHPLANVLAGLVLAALIFLIIAFSKGKAIGSGDVFVFALSGLILGAKAIIAFYIIIFSATIVGLLLAYRKGKLKGYRIPFVPFIVGGTFITFFFWPELAQLLKTFPVFYFITANG